LEAGSRRTTTDEAGRYSVASVPSGSYQVRVTTGFLNLAQPRPIVVGDRDVEADLEVGARAALLVEVIDGGGNPVAGQEVELEQGLDDGAVGTSERTDAAGRVRFDGLLPTEARLAGPLLAAQKIDLRRPRDRPVRLVSSDRGGLQGHLRAAPGT